MRLDAPVRVGLALAVGAGLFTASCTDAAQARLARRILEDHRSRAKVKPLPAAQVVRIHLSSASGQATGTETIEWDEGNYRETISSAGLTTVHGIQAEKGYFTDEDGVTRVASEPLLSDLLTRFYFWKRGYLFDDLERARVALGPAGEASVSVRITPHGGDPLLLTFRQHDLALLSARAKHFGLVFSSPTRFQDSSHNGIPVNGEVLWNGLPTGPLRDVVAGGWSARWRGSAVEAPLTRAGRAVTLPAKVSGEPVVLALDAAEDGPLRLRSALADRLGLAFAPDVFGRAVARGATLEIGELSYPSLAVERTDSLDAGTDAAAGGVVFRETVVEIDRAATLVRLHDPARWVSREGFFRVLVDDDGDRPVAIVSCKGKRLRLLAPTAIAGPIALTPEAQVRLGIAGQTEVSGVHWGAALPPLPLLASSEAEGAFGEDGRLGWDLVLRFHAFFDMPHRWAYLKPTS